MFDVSPRSTGAVVADALFRGRDWRHRKIESVRLMEDRHGRRRVSIDCTPPPDVSLAFEVAERDSATVDDVEGLVMVPLALIAKGTLRHFDVHGADGAPLPVLTRAENREVALATLAYELLDEQDLDDADRIDALRQLVNGDPNTATEIAGELLTSGTVGGTHVVEPSSISEFGATLVQELAVKFLLIVLVPADVVGVRQVFKYSFHWRTSFREPRHLRPVQRLRVAAGLMTATLELEVSGPNDAAAYHLEVHAPTGLECAGLVLPSRGRRAGTDDASTDVIAHAVAAYDDSPHDDPASLQLAVPRQGLRFLTALVSAYTALVIGLALFLPRAQYVLAEAGDGAVAILLAAPAVVIALLARPGENVIASNVLAPHRVVVVACSMTLLAVGASLVGQLEQPWLDILWWSGFLGAVGTSLLFVAGLFVGGRWDTDST